MKYRLLKTITALAVSVGAIFSAAYAIDISPANGLYTVSGTATVPAQIMSVNVYGENGAAHLSYAVTDKNGNFSYSFAMPESCEPGKYTLKLTSYDEEIFSGEFMYADEEKKVDIISALNSADSSDAAKAALDELVAYYMFAEPTGFALSDDAKKEIYSRIADTDVFTMDNYAEILREIFAYSSIKFAVEQDVDKILAEYENDYNFKAERYYGVYEKSGNTSVIHKMLLKNEFDSMEELREVFNTITVLDAMNREDSHGGIVDVITEYSDVFPESVTELSSSDKRRLALQILSKDIYTMAELEIEVNNLPEEEKKSSSGGGSGSSASSGAITSIGTMPTDTDSSTDWNKKLDFADMKDAEWARKAIFVLTGRGVLSGYDTGDFKPNNSITREEFVKVIVTAFDVKSDLAESGFEDITASHWAHSYVCAARGSALVNGVSDTEFGAGRKITRQDMAVMIYNALNSTGAELEYTEADTFTDIDEAAAYAKTAVSAMRSSGIIGGYEDGSFRPKGNATRAEAAQMIYNALKRTGKI